MNEQNNQEEQIKIAANSIKNFIVTLIVMTFKILIIAFVGTKALSMLHINVKEVATDKYKNYELLITNDSPFIFTCLIVMVTILFFSTIGNMYNQSQTNEQ